MKRVTAGELMTLLSSIPPNTDVVLCDPARSTPAHVIHHITFDPFRVAVALHVEEEAIAHG